MGLDKTKNFEVDFLLLLVNISFCTVTTRLMTTKQAGDENSAVPGRAASGAVKFHQLQLPTDPDSYETQLCEKSKNQKMKEKTKASHCGHT